MDLKNFLSPSVQAVFLRAMAIAVEDGRDIVNQGDLLEAIEEQKRNASRLEKTHSPPAGDAPSPSSSSAG